VAASGEERTLATQLQGLLSARSSQCSDLLRRSANFL
jgi:hypothetical protein